MTLVILLIILIIFVNSHDVEKMTTYKQAYDGRIYKVSSAFSDTDSAANKMAELNQFIIDYMRELRRDFVIGKLGNRQEREFVRRMLKNYNIDNLFENNPKPGEETSFVTNKGSEFGVCLRRKIYDRNKIHNEDSLLQFVILHELTHLGCLGYGHGAEFWSWFRWVLIQADRYNLHKPVNYGCKKNAVNYCGLDVQYNPFFNNKKC